MWTINLRTPRYWVTMLQVTHCFRVGFAGLVDDLGRGASTCTGRQGWWRRKGAGAGRWAFVVGWVVLRWGFGGTWCDDMAEGKGSGRGGRVNVEVVSANVEGKSEN
jgi:hypothetical protein